MAHNSTLRNARGGIDIGDELPPLMVRLQAKVNIANDFLHSNWDKTIQLGRKMEAEVVQAVKDMLSVDEPTSGQLAQLATGNQDLSEAGTRVNVSGGEVQEFGSRQWFNNLDEIPF